MTPRLFASLVNNGDCPLSLYPVEVQDSIKKAVRSGTNASILNWSLILVGANVVTLMGILLFIDEKDKAPALENIAMLSLAITICVVAFVAWYNMIYVPNQFEKCEHAMIQTGKLAKFLDMSYKQIRAEHEMGSLGKCVEKMLTKHASGTHLFQEAHEVFQWFKLCESKDPFKGTKAYSHGHTGRGGSGLA